MNLAPNIVSIIPFILIMFHSIRANSLTKMQYSIQVQMQTPLVRLSHAHYMGMFSEKFSSHFTTNDANKHR